MSNKFDDIDSDIPLDKLKGIAGGSGKSHHGGIDEEDSINVSHDNDGIQSHADGDVSVKSNNYSYSQADGKTEVSGTIGIDATASGSAEVKAGDADLKASASVEVIDGATGDIHSDKEDTGFSAKAGTGVEAKGEVDTSIGNSDTNLSASGTVDAKLGTEATASGDVYHGDGHYGAKGSAGAFDDAGVKATTTVGGEVDGNGGSATVGGSVGDTGVGGSFDGEYQNHELKFGLEGAIGIDICGVNVGFSAEINTKPYEHAVLAVSHWLTGAGHDVGHELSKLEHAATSFGHDVGHAATSVGHDVGHAATSVVNDVGDGAKAVGHAATSVVNDVGDGAKAVGHAATSVVNDVGDGVKDVADDTKHVASSAVHTISHTLSNWF